MGDPTSKMNGAGNASTTSNASKNTGTVSNLKWWGQITGNYPKRTTEQERAALDGARADLDAIDIAIAGTVKSYWNRDKGLAHPGHRTIADGARVDKDTVSPRIERLEAAGWLHVERRPGRAGWRYYLRSPLDTLSRPEGDIPEGEDCPVDDEDCPADPPTLSRPGRDLTREQEIEQPGRSEDEDLTTFLDLLFSKLQPDVRDRLETQRRSPTNRPVLKEVGALVGDQPTRRANDLLRARWDLNKAKTLGYIVKALRDVEPPPAPRGDVITAADLPKGGPPPDDVKADVQRALARGFGLTLEDDQHDPNRVLDSIDRWGKSA